MDYIGPVCSWFGQIFCVYYNFVITGSKRIHQVKCRVILKIYNLLSEVIVCVSTISAFLTKISMCVYVHVQMNQL